MSRAFFLPKFMIKDNDALVKIAEQGVEIVHLKKNVDSITDHIDELSAEIRSIKEILQTKWAAAKFLSENKIYITCLGLFCILVGALINDNSIWKFVFSKV